MTYKKLHIDWLSIAYDNIEVKFICPICTYQHSSKEYVKNHIYNTHEPSEIKEICSE